MTMASNTSSPNDGVSLRELFFIVRRWRNLVLGMTAAGVLLALLAGMMQPKYYSATALILVQPRENRVVDFRDGSGNVTVDAAMLETHVKVLLSRDLGLRVVDDLRLADDPEFQRSANTHGTLTRLVAQGMATLAGLVPAGTLQWLGIEGPPAKLEPHPLTADPSLSMERSVALSEFGRRIRDPERQVVRARGELLGRHGRQGGGDRQRHGRCLSGDAARGQAGGFAGGQSLARGAAGEPARRLSPRPRPRAELPHLQQYRDHHRW
jgi:hypothetical protein